MQSLCYTQEIWIQTFIFKSGYCEKCVGTRSCPMTPLIAIEQAHHLRFEAEITENFPQCIYCIKDICGNLFRCCLWHFCLVIYVELDIKPRKEFCVLFCINSSLDWKYFCNNRKISDLFSTWSHDRRLNKKHCVVDLSSFHFCSDNGGIVTAYVTKQNHSTAGAKINGITSTSCTVEPTGYIFGSKFRKIA